MGRLGKITVESNRHSMEISVDLRRYEPTNMPWTKKDTIRKLYVEVNFLGPKGLLNRYMLKS
jgi:hypothetical protein